MHLRKLFIISMVVALAVVLRLYNLNEMGRTMDEDYIVEKGHKFITLARRGDFTNPYWYITPDHPPLANYLYGVVAGRDVIGFDPRASAMDHAYRGVPIFAYDLTNSRLVSVLLSSLTIFLVCLFGWNYLSPFVGITAGVILATNPFYLGLSQLVNLETPFMFFFTATVYAFFRYLSRPTFCVALLTGVLFGCTLETKQTAVLIFPLLGGIYLLRFRFPKLPTQKSRLIHLVTLLSAALLTYVLLWPMPWFHLSHFLDFTYKMWFTGGPGYPEFFLGGLRITHFYYYMVYFLITTPALLLAAFFHGAALSIIRKRWILLAILLWFTIPFIGQSLFKLRQHQLRYLIEIYAPFALLAAFGIEQALKRFSPQLWVTFVSLFLIGIYLLGIVWKTTPYYLDYFNELVGGAKTVYQQRWFQLGWGGQGERAAGVYLEKHARKGATVGLALDPIRNIKQAAGLRFTPYDNRRQYDWVVVNYYFVIRDGFDKEQVRKKYKLVCTISADGAELVHIYKRNMAK